MFAERPWKCNPFSVTTVAIATVSAFAYIAKIDVVSNVGGKKNYTMKKFSDEQWKITYTNKMCSSAGLQAFSIIIEWHIH